MTTIEWVRGEDGSDGMSWNALRAVRKTTGKSANHCEHVNEACRFCYADRTNPRLGGLPFKPGHRKDYDFVVDQEKLTAPLRKRKPTRIFVESMSDAFGEWWPRDFMDQLYAVMALTPQHVYINLSKRPKERQAYLADPDTPNDVTKRIMEIGKGFNGLYGEWLQRTNHATRYYGQLVGEIAGRNPAPKITAEEMGWPLPNVIEGTSVSCQSEADEFVPILLRTNAAWRCMSAEPLLGPVKLPRKMNLYDGEIVRPVRLDWVIVGGESGPHARPMHPAWARDIRDQCTAANVPFFFKQWGEWAPHTPVAGGDLGGDVRRGRVCMVHPGGEDDVEVSRLTGGRSTLPGSRYMARVGKKAAGRLLDGRTWDQFPDVKAKMGEAA